MKSKSYPMFQPSCCNDIKEAGDTIIFGKKKTEIRKNEQEGQFGPLAQFALRAS